MMIVGYDAKRAFSNNTGLGNYSRTLIRAMGEHYPENRILLYTPAKTRNERMKDILALKNISVKTPSGFLRGAAWRTFGLAYDLRRDQVNVYHGLSNELPVNIHRSRIRSVITVHDIIFKRFPQFYPAADRLIYDLKTKSGCRKADAIVAVSNRTKEDMVAAYKIPQEKINVIYQSCDPIFLSPVTAHTMKSVAGNYKLPAAFMLYVGSVTPRKNLMGIVNAMRLMKNDIPLLVIGSGGDYLKSVRKYVDENRLAHRVIWNSDVPFADFPAIYSLARFLVYPSHQEGFGIPVIESLYCGTPVVASAGTSLEEAGGPAQVYVNPADTEQLAAALDRVTDDQMLRQEMAMKGKAYVRRFNGTVIAEEWMSLYTRLAG